MWRILNIEFFYSVFSQVYNDVGGFRAIFCKSPNSVQTWKTKE